MHSTATEPATSAGSSFTAERCHYWVVPHTHWDREWYLPMEHFRMLLARTVDELLDVLDADDRLVFTLDGQTIVVDDYLELRPERRDQLLRLIDSGRIAIGPCYILPDQFLVGAESHVRNLLAGREDCRRFGARPMMAGYVPDAFGHTAQFPQILRGFGIDNFLFGRGMGEEWFDLGMAFNWEGPDGSSVLALPLPDSYHNAFMLGTYELPLDGKWPEPSNDDPAETATRHIRTLLERHRTKYERSDLHDVILCNGLDHLPIQADLPEVLEGVRERLPEATFDIVTYERYVDRMREWSRDRSLGTFHGELIGGLEQNVLRGVNSARMYLKQANEHAEVSLQTAETLANLAAMKHWGTEFPYRFPRIELRLAWRELMKNHPHDSICGCSVDEVHQDMHQRFASVGQLVDRIRREAMSALADTEEPWSYRPAAHVQSGVMNPLPWARRRSVALPIPEELANARTIHAVAGDEHVPAQLVDRDGDRHVLVDVATEGFGNAQFELRRGSGDTSSTSLTTGDTWIDNGTLRVEAAPNGTLTVTEHASGRNWSGLLTFEDAGDRGDEYNFDPIPGEQWWTSSEEQPSIAVVESGPVRTMLRIDHTVRIPKAIAKGRDSRSTTAVPCRVTTLASLSLGGDRVEFTTTVDNRARDHRLRVLFPTGSNDDTVRAEQHFAIVERPLERPSKNWIEPPQPTEHTISLVATRDAATMTKGLPEYQAFADSTTGATTIAITLLRCTDRLSREDLGTRPKGHAGPGEYTPEAQCLGSHTFEYAFAPLQTDTSSGALVRMSQDYRTDFAIGPATPTANDFALSGDAVQFTALKDAEDATGARVVRLANPGAEAATVTLNTSWAKSAVRMDEQDGDSRISIEGSSITIPAYAVATIRLEPAND